MKKGIALIELVVSITISSILLMVVVSLMVFCTSIINKQEDNRSQHNDLINAENFIKSFIDKSETINLTNDGNGISNNESNKIHFDTITKELFSNDKVVGTLSTINDIIFKEEGSLIIVEFHVQKIGTNDNIIYRYSYFNL